MPSIIPGSHPGTIISIINFIILIQYLSNLYNPDQMIRKEIITSNKTVPMSNFKFEVAPSLRQYQSPGHLKDAS